MQISVVFAGLLHWVHLFSAVAWVGGLFFYLMVLLPSLKDLDPPAARRLSFIVGMRFRAVSLISLFALLLTGLYLFGQLMQGVNHAAFFASPYGRILGIKIALALLAIGTGIFIGFGLAPKLVAALEAHDEARIRSVGKFMGILSGISFLLGLAITVCVAMLRVSA